MRFSFLFGAILLVSVVQSEARNKKDAALPVGQIVAKYSGDHLVDYIHKFEKQYKKAMIAVEGKGAKGWIYKTACSVLNVDPREACIFDRLYNKSTHHNIIDLMKQQIAGQSPSFADHLRLCEKVVGGLQSGGKVSYLKQEMHAANTSLLAVWARENNQPVPAVTTARDLALLMNTVDPHTKQYIIDDNWLARFLVNSILPLVIAENVFGVKVA